MRWAIYILAVFSLFIWFANMLGLPLLWALGVIDKQLATDAFFFAWALGFGGLVAWWLAWLTDPSWT